MTRHGFALTLLASLIAGTAVAETLSPEADACKASGLLALKQKYPRVKDVLIDLDSARIIKADTTIENVPIRTVVIGDAYVERTKIHQAADARMRDRGQGKSPADAVFRQVKLRYASRR